MSREQLQRELDRIPNGGEVEVPIGADRARVDVVEADRLGVRVRGLVVERDAPVDVGDEALRLPDRLRALPERVAPVEVAPELGGARLRTRPDELRGAEFFEVDVEARRTSLRRTRVVDGERTAADFTLTRDQLERLIEETIG